MKITQDQITNILLKLISVGSSAAVAHGWKDSSMWTLLAEAAPGIAAIIYSHYWTAQPANATTSLNSPNPNP
jgi:hypothetical protein